jgi:hypothetical protein
MNNTKVLEEFFIWEENNSTEPKMKLENKTESEQKDSMINTTTVNEYENWKTITDPKLRKKMRKKAYYQINKHKNKAYNERNKDRIKIRSKVYNEKNKEKIKEQKKAYSERNKDKFIEYKKDWKKSNRERLLVKGKTYYETNKEIIKIKNKNYRSRQEVKQKRNDTLRLKRKNDIQYRLKCILRKRLNTALSNNFKKGDAVKDLGCTISEFKIYLENKFQPGMSWDNHGQFGWHIDHIKPLSSFDLSNRKQLLDVCHYTNLQPLWWQDNLSKGDKIK